MKLIQRALTPDPPEYLIPHPSIAIEGSQLYLSRVFYLKKASQTLFGSWYTSSSYLYVRGDHVSISLSIPIILTLFLSYHFLLANRQKTTFVHLILSCRLILAFNSLSLSLSLLGHPWMAIRFPLGYQESFVASDWVTLTSSATQRMKLIMN